MKYFEHSKWIWCGDMPCADEYGEFFSSFVYSGGEIFISISADSNYALYLNGKLCTFGQYADFPYDKVYDTVDIAPFCRNGENMLAIIVWYYGISTTSVYYPGKAGLLFDVVCAGKSICFSSEKTLSRRSLSYQNHRKKIITGQLGLGFAYDITKEDDWKTGTLCGFSESAIVEQTLPLRPRPCEKLSLLSAVMGKTVRKVSDTDIIFGLGVNTVGFLQIETESEAEQTLLISYGEHLADGVVRRKIGNRDFSAEVRVRKGKSFYLNPFRRFGCRYLEVQSQSPLTNINIAIVPTVYPVEEKRRPNLTKDESEIYDICIRTLRLCMHEHYEDCPWREQALYAMDSRNQMLCGYYAFGEYRFPRANLELIAKDDREDGLLSICYPIKMDLVIPSFSLHYFTSCAEYLKYSGDLAFLREIYPKLERVLSVFLAKMEASGDLILPFSGKCYWNFYEWRKGLDGDKTIDVGESDLILNTLLSIALQKIAEISHALSVKNDYAAIAEKLNFSIRAHFYCAKENVFFDRVSTETRSVLGNSLAILCGACDKECAIALCEKMLFDEDFTKISLSMKCFLYDALLLTDSVKYGPVILEDIEKAYRPMVDYGTGTVWETEIGERDFGKAGSLCHGWSALPIYYYHVLK